MLTRAQTVVTAAWGAALWLVFALAIQSVPFVFTGGAIHLALFVVSLPVAWFSVSLTVLVCRLRADQVLAGLSVALAVAMLLDGVAITWFHSLYGATESHVRAGAGYILWGAGLILGAACWRQHRP